MNILDTCVFGVKIMIFKLSLCCHGRYYLLVISKPIFFFFLFKVQINIKITNEVFMKKGEAEFP